MPRKNERNGNQKLTYPQLLGQAVCLENSLPKARDLKHPARWPPTQPHFDTLSRRCHWQFAFSFVVMHCYIHCCSLLDSFNSFILVYFMTVHAYIIVYIYISKHLYHSSWFNSHSEQSASCQGTTPDTKSTARWRSRVEMTSAWHCRVPPLLLLRHTSQPICGSHR